MISWLFLFMQISNLADMNMNNAKLFCDTYEKVSKLNREIHEIEDFVNKAQGSKKFNVKLSYQTEVETTMIRVAQRPASLDESFLLPNYMREARMAMWGTGGIQEEPQKSTQERNITQSIDEAAMLRILSVIMIEKKAERDTLIEQLKQINVYA